jgi:hypothetical protein
MCTCILYTHIRINSGYNGTDVVPNREVIVHVMLGRDVYWHKHHTPSATSGKYTHAGVELPRLPPGVLADVYTPTSSWQSSRTLSIEAGYVRSCVCVCLCVCMSVHGFLFMYTCYTGAHHRKARSPWTCLQCFWSSRGTLSCL